MKRCRYSLCHRLLSPFDETVDGCCNKEKYLMRNEAAGMLKCDLSTIHNWTKKDKLVAQKMGNRVSYKRSQIESEIIIF